MATRFYLRASGTSPVTPPALPSGWVAGTTPAYAAPAVTTKSDTALANFLVAENVAANFNIPTAIFVSDALAAQSIAGNVTAVVRAMEGASASDDSLQVGVYLIAGDGSSVKQTLYAGHAAALNATVGALGQEIASASQQTRIIPSTALTTQSADAGDRLMLIVGYRTHEASLTVRDSTLRLGDPSAIADFALTAGLTTDLVPWVELSADITFGGGPSSAEGTAALDVGLALAVAGRRDSTGTAASGLGLAISAGGRHNSAGTAALDLALNVAAAGARSSAGTVPLGLALDIVAVGNAPAPGVSDGSAALGLVFQVAAIGRSPARGSADLAFVLALNAGALPGGQTGAGPRYVSISPAGRFVSSTPRGRL